MYSATPEEVAADGKKYRSEYPPFVPRRLTPEENSHILKLFQIAVTTQNGMDFDDYMILPDGGKLKVYLDGHAPGKLLLLGVGTGRETRVAQDLGFDTVGVTLGSRNIEFGKRYLGLTDENHQEAIAEALPFPSGSFDYVLGCQFFEHTYTPMLFLLEQGRILKTGGKIILEWPPPNNYSQGSNPHHQVCYTPGQARALLMKAGFINIKLFYPDGSTIPESEYWRGDQDRYLCIEGEKGPANQPWLQQAWQ